HPAGVHRQGESRADLRAEGRVGAHARGDARQGQGAGQGDAPVAPACLRARSACRAPGMSKSHLPVRRVVGRAPGADAATWSMDMKKTGWVMTILLLAFLLPASVAPKLVAAAVATDTMAGLGWSTAGVV